MEVEFYKSKGSSFLLITIKQMSYEIIPRNNTELLTDDYLIIFLQDATTSKRSNYQID